MGLSENSRDGSGSRPSLARYRRSSNRVGLSAALPYITDSTMILHTASGNGPPGISSKDCMHAESAGKG